MITLFDQEYALNAYIGEKEDLAEKRGLIRGAVEMCQDMGQSFDSTVNRLTAKFNLPANKARAQVQEFWRN